MRYQAILKYVHYIHAPFALPSRCFDKLMLPRDTLILLIVRAERLDVM